ncbi:MAG TPA: DUF1800 family protein [Candidatus Polarisedimenticolaceae bacterium]
MAARRFIRLAAPLCLAAMALPSRASMTPEDSARFLGQATLGANWEEIHRTATLGRASWLDEQFAKPVGRHRPFLDARSRLGLEVTAEHRRWSWWEQVMEGPDPLRQRVALALSEIFVVSDANDAVGNNPIGLADYYDMLLDRAFGNYRDLLLDVTLHPVMGAYLSHLRNERSNPAAGRYPDENYAREIMQLFSIGLFQLNADGTLKLDGAGRPMPTYDNDDITEFAKIFTGLSFASPSRDFRRGTEVWTEPMRMHDEFHEPGPKRLLRGKYVPAGQTGMKDVNDAIDNLFQHPNVGPFLSRRLIQRLVTSNPSPEYIGRVAAVFADDGAGVRGNLKAVVRAILLDPEAATPPGSSDVARGRLQESFLRRVHLARAFDARSPAAEYRISDPGAPVAFGQRPLSSPTVFNFFLPDHQPTGEIADAGIVAPEFQIVTAVTAITSANDLRSQVDGVMNRDDDEVFEVRLDLSDEIATASDARQLVDRLDLLLMHGEMSAAMRGILVGALERLDDPASRARLAVHLIALSPEYNVSK